ncbi:hypothetical protein [Streptomyces sp. NPDC020747]|uniref:wHTH domain-containing protein n=1 Tax=Streptomyces sp. NPDC020747 TaxID=3365086 RepID=UPI00378F6BCC
MTERGAADNRISDTTAHGPVIQARTIESLVINTQAAQAPLAGTPEATPHRWASEVEASRLWSLLPDGPVVGETLATARGIAAELGVLHDDSERELLGDPWWDREFASRFRFHADHVVCDKTDADWGFHPVEVMLLTLAPYLSQTLWIRTAAGRVHVGPAELGERGGGGARASFEKFCGDGYERLVRRATLKLPGRQLPGPGGAQSDIGWWLFHQWLDHGLRGREDHWTAYADLVGRLTLREPHVQDVFDQHRTGQLLYGLRLPLSEMCRPERLGRFGTSTTVGDGLHVPQKLRLKRLVSLLGVARARALDVPALPDDLVENLGIPHPVDLEQLRKTVRGALWDSDHGPMVLQATCHHEAVVEALRQHVEQVDVLLDDVHRAVRADGGMKPLHLLPMRASAEGLSAAPRADGTPTFESYSKFRVDPRRVQNLLMGDQLYRSPALAIRELYQNALDACRYRKARTEYLGEEPRQEGIDREEERWRGQIRFTQGVDGERPYLDCWDNGIGMGESELTRVFARAGTRFTDLTDVRNERGNWEAAGIRMYPVSRFGIGVLSYFMIADEIEVVTRKLKEDGGTGDCYKVAIYGPNQLFRIVPGSFRSKAGTTVRLHLRAGAPSCVQELTRLLGFTDFDTSASHASISAKWKAGTFRLRKDPRAQDKDSLRAFGTQVTGPPEADSGVPRVVWCEEGGGVLVDGILTRPTRRRGVLADLRGGAARMFRVSRDEGLRGAVVNLTGELVPKLSIDRLQILDDVSDDVEKLLCAAADELARSGSELLNYDWISEVAGASPKVADIIARAVMDADLELELPDGRPFRPADVGILPEDQQLVAWTTGHDRSTSVSHVPDHILLWRTLAHARAERLVELVPELAEVGPLLPALPSDTAVFNTNGSWLNDENWTKPGHVLWVAVRTGMTPRQVVRRAADLRIATLPTERYLDTDPDPLDLALLSLDGSAEPGWHSTDLPVPLGHFIEAYLRHGVSVRETAARMERYGFVVTQAAGLPDRPDPLDLSLLSMDGEGEGDEEWWDTDSPVPPGHALSMVVRTPDLSPADVCTRLRRYGLTVADLPDLRGPHDLRLLSRGLDAKPGWIGHEETVPYGHLMAAARSCHMEVADVATVLEAYGLRAQTTPSADWSASDRMLLGTDDDTEFLWSPRTEVSCQTLWEVAEEFEMPLRAVVERLRELGVHTSLTFPEELTELDEALLDIDLDLWEDRYTHDTDVSVPELLLTARRLRTSPNRIAARLDTYGLRTLRYDRPESDDIRDDLILLSRDLDGRASWINDDGPVRLGHLAAAAQRLDITIVDAAERLRRLGLDVPDVRDMIRAAMAKLPRPRYE